MPRAIWGFNVLLIRGHESMSRLDALLDFWIVHLKQQAELTRDWITYFCHLAKGTVVSFEPEPSIVKPQTIVGILDILDYQF